jgi:CubicO group peptidase (beta-lactamase class C family)
MSGVPRRRFLAMSAATVASIPLWASVPTAFAAPATSLPRAGLKDIFAQVDAQAEQILAKYKVPGMSVGIVDREELIYAKGYGIKTAGRSQPYTSMCVQSLADFSKAVTGVAIMQLVERGKIKVDRPVVEYLPYFHLKDPRYKRITVLHLISHLSGLPQMTPAEAALPYPDCEFLDPWYDAGAIERYVRGLYDADVVLVNDPGVQTQDFQYSDIGYDMLGDVIHKVSGQLFEEYCEEHIFEPLGMRHSTFLKRQVDPKLLVGVCAYAPGDPVVTSVYPYARQHGPSLCLHSNVPDMSRWIAAFMNNGILDGHRILSPASVRRLWNPPLMHWLPEAQRNATYGWGWVFEDVEGHPSPMMWGGGYWYMQSQLSGLLDRRYAVLAWTNRDPFPDWPVGDLVYATLHSLLALK